MAVIAITQQFGSRGDELGRIVARELGYRYLAPQDIYSETSRRYNVSPDQLVVIDERAPHFWERVKTDVPIFACFYRATLLRELAMDRVVAVGRGVAHTLPQVGCGLRLHAVAPLAHRVKQVAADENLQPAAAERRVLLYDREVRTRIQSISNVDIEDPLLYDLVINTAHQPLQSLAGAVAALARQVDATARAEQWQALRDAALSQQVLAALMAHPKIRDAQIAVRCRSGAVQLNGPSLVPPWDELVGSVARTIEGVTSVAVAAEEPPMPQGPA
jgi:cytidylate kinase